MLPYDEIPGLKLGLQKIYPITDRNLSGLSHAEQVAGFIDGGATVVQIREKYLLSRDFFDDAVAAVKVAQSADVLVLINDRVDIALMCGADGVHLGQDDLPAAEARRILGREAIIGVSTHSLDQVRAAHADRNADYIAFGPIFGTSTKPDHQPVVGIQALGHAVKLAGEIPVVAIGGINSLNLGSILLSGASSAAMISEFYRPGTQIPSRFKTLLADACLTNNVVRS